MLVCRLQDVLWDKRMRLSDLARITGLDYGNLWKLYHNRTRAIRFHVLEKICLALDCSPGDLFRIENGSPPHQTSSPDNGGAA